MRTEPPLPVCDNSMVFIRSCGGRATGSWSGNSTLTLRLGSGGNWTETTQRCRKPSWPTAGSSSVQVNHPCAPRPPSWPLLPQSLVCRPSFLACPYFPVLPVAASISRRPLSVNPHFLPPSFSRRSLTHDWPTLWGRLSLQVGSRRQHLCVASVESRTGARRGAPPR